MIENRINDDMNKPYVLVPVRLCLVSSCFSASTTFSLASSNLTDISGLGFQHVLLGCFPHSVSLLPVPFLASSLPPDHSYLGTNFVMV